MQAEQIKTIAVIAIMVIIAIYKEYTRRRGRSSGGNDAAADSERPGNDAMPAAKLRVPRPIPAPGPASGLGGAPDPSSEGERVTAETVALPPVPDAEEVVAAHRERWRRAIIDTEIINRKY